MITFKYFSDELAQRYLNEKIFAFDIETDTYNYHWDAERGLSYVAGITHISFYNPKLPLLVLKSSPIDVPHLAEIVNPDTGEIEEYPVTLRDWKFSDELHNFIVSMFSRDDYTAIAHNLVFDARQIFGKFNIPVNNTCTLWDTQAIHLTGGWRLTNGGNDDFDLLEANEEEDRDDNEVVDDKKEGLSLEKLTANFLKPSVRQWWEGMKSERAWLTQAILDPKTRIKRWGNELTEEEVIHQIDAYAAIDSKMAYDLYEWQNKQEWFDKLDDDNHGIHFQSLKELIDIDLEYTKLCVRMSATGLKANIKYLREQRAKYTTLWLESLDALGVPRDQGSLTGKKNWQQLYILGIPPKETKKKKKKVEAIDDYINNPLTVKGMSDIPTDPLLIETFKLKTKTGAWSFGKDAIEYYTKLRPELINYRRHVDIKTKLKKIDELLRHSEYDGRVHSNLSRLQVTGRTTSSSPNLMNMKLKYKGDKYPGIPELEYGYFLPDEGKVLISLDCSNAENWMGASYARDNIFAKALCNKNFHSYMTPIYFPNINLSDPDEFERWRSIGKNVTFAGSYGAGNVKLSFMTKQPVETIKKMVENKNRTFWRVRDVKEIAEAFMIEHGYTVLWTGRRVNARKKDGQYKGYTAPNSQNQGGVGELLVRGMLAVDKLFRNNNYSSRVALQVHDEIVIELDIKEYKQVIIPIIEALSHIVPESWLNRTTPATRFLFDLCNRENSKKWGLVPGEKYPLPDEYVNLWGIHQYAENEDKAPTWINEFGYGEQALEKELGLEEENPIPKSKEPFNWHILETEVKSTLDLFSIREYNNRIFSFPEFIELSRALYHKGQESDYPKYLDKFNSLLSIMEKYKEWINS